MNDDRLTSDALARLLGREPDREYLEAWARAVDRSAFARLESAEGASLVFRIGPQWLAMPLDVLREVHPFRPVRRIPGRSNDVFRGLVNLRGELQMCGDLHALLHAPVEPHAARDARDAASVLASIRVDGSAWTFEMDEVLGVERHGEDQLVPGSATLEQALVHYTTGLLRIGERTAARLAPDRVIEAFEEALR